MTKSKFSRADLFYHLWVKNPDPYLAFHKTNGDKPRVAKAIVKKLEERFHKGQTLRILDIGCGGGELTDELIKQLIASRSKWKIHLTATDPSPTMLDMAQNHLKKWEKPTKIELDFLRVKVAPKPEPRLYDTLGSKQFDFVLASYVMFWLENWDDALDQFFECLSPNGLVCVIMTSREKGEKCSRFRQELLGITHQETNFEFNFFAEDFEKILKKRNDCECQPELIKSTLSLKSKDYQARLAFLMAFPNELLTPKQKKRLEQVENKLPKSGKLTCNKKLLWVSPPSPPPLPPFPLKFTKAEFYYIYPFVFNFQSLPDDPESTVLRDWVFRERDLDLGNEFPLKWGLPPSWQGFPPLLSYRSLMEEFGYCEWGKKTPDQIEKADAELIEDEGTLEIGVKETFIIRGCGNGSLTYEITVTRNKNPSVEDFLGPIIRLVPRVGCEPLSKLKRDHLPLETKLFEDAKRRLKRLEDLLKKSYPKTRTEFLWEDPEVIFFDREKIENQLKQKPQQDPILQPFAFMVLYLPSEIHENYRDMLDRLSEGKVQEKERDKLKRFKQATVALLYRYSMLRLFRKVSISDEKFLELGFDTSFNKHMLGFANRSSVIVIVNESQLSNSVAKEHNPAGLNPTEINKHYLYTLLSVVEFFITQHHFAKVLDALLDKHLRKISKIQSPGSEDAMVALQESQDDFYRLQLQAALLLEDLSQYARSGYLGAEIYLKLWDVFQSGVTQERIREKIEMTERVLLGKKLTIDEAICELTRPKPKKRK